MASSRRLGLAAVVVALCALPACSGGEDRSAASTRPAETVAPLSTTPEGGPAVEASFATVQGLPFTEPEVLRSRNGTLDVTLDVREAQYEVGGVKVSGMTFTGQSMGPTLVLDPGDTLTFSVVNGLDEETNLHEHGLHVSPIGISDNVLRVMEPGSTSPVVVNIPDDQAPGTYWYHAHLHGFTEAQVMAGLFGALIINGLGERLPAEL